MDRRKEQDTIMDRHERTIAGILRRFMNIVEASTEAIPKGATIEKERQNAMTLEIETAALITEIENLLKISREIRTLWIRGTLRKPGEGSSRDDEIDEKAKALESLYDQAVEKWDKQLKAMAEAKITDPSSGEPMEQ